MKKFLVAKSQKVKSVDFHPSFPWVLVALFTGSIIIYDYNTQATLHFLEVTNSPIRCAKFIPDKNLFVCGSDDKKVRVYNYNTMEKVKEFEAHSDFLRCILVKDSYLLTSSDDQTICLFDIDKNFNLIRTYEEHKNFVMKLCANPKDTNAFASASMDCRIKIWSFNSANSHMTLEGHQKGVTSISFSPSTDKPYLASGSDDKTVKIWDYTNKHCIFTFEGHEEYISSLIFHPELPILISASEDATCKFWNVNTFKLEDSRLFGYETIWDIAAQPSQNMIAFGCEEGTMVVRMGSDQPLAAFNNSQPGAKIIYAKGNAIFSLNLKMISTDVKDGETIDIVSKSVGSSELFPCNLKFSPNGRHFAITDEKDFVVSTSAVYRSNCVGKGTSLAWVNESDFAVKDEKTVRLYKSFKEFKSFKPGFGYEEIFSGPYFTVKTSDSIFIYDFETTLLIRKIDVSPSNVIWSDNKKFVALICEDITYILQVFADVIEKYIEEEEPTEGGCESSLSAFFEIEDKIINGLFVDNVFIYVNNKNKINYALEDRIFSITTLNSNYALQGYLPSSNKIFLMNKNFNLISYSFPLSFVNYQTAILKKDFNSANKLLKLLPDEYIEKVTNFLEKFELFDLCYEVCKNSNQKFSLAIRLKKLTDARTLALESASSQKWKMVADLAFELGEFKHAEEAMMAAKDYNGLLLYYSIINDREKISLLAESADQNGIYNISFSCYFSLNDLEKAFDTLIKSGKIPEAALFCRTYFPSKLASVLQLWNDRINEEEANNRIDIKVINPLENLDASKIAEMENFVNGFYDQVKTLDTKHNSKLLSFVNDFEIESHLGEGDELDLSKLLSLY